MMTAAQAKNFRPTPVMLKTAQTVFLTMAAVETIKPVVIGYKTKILADMKPRSIFVDEIITDPGSDYEMSDEDFKIYHERCNIEMEKAGLKVDDPEYCPLLVAQDLLRQARQALVKAVEPITGIDFETAASHPYMYDELVELTLRLLAPYMSTKPGFKF